MCGVYTHSSLPESSVMANLGSSSSVNKDPQAEPANVESHNRKRARSAEPVLEQRTIISLPVPEAGSSTYRLPRLVLEVQFVPNHTHCNVNEFHPYMNEGYDANLPIPEDPVDPHYEEDILPEDPENPIEDLQPDYLAQNIPFPEFTTPTPPQLLRNCPSWRNSSMDAFWIGECSPHKCILELISQL